MEERRVRRNGRGQIVSYEIEKDANGFPLAAYGVVEFGNDVTLVDKWSAESYNRQFDLEFYELDFEDIPNVELNPTATIYQPTSAGGTFPTNAGGGYVSGTNIDYSP